VLHPPSDMADSLDPLNSRDSDILNKLHEILGDFFATKVAEDAAWAREIVGATPKP
jgi:transcription initiation factor TFIID subunit 6